MDEGEEEEREATESDLDRDEFHLDEYPVIEEAKPQADERASLFSLLNARVTVGNTAKT
jgi:hypothetical protein